MLEYAGQRDDPDHEWRCAALLAALAWTHRQLSQVGRTDIEWVCRDLTQHLARSCREGLDIEVLVDAFVNLGLENARGGQTREPSPAHVKLARDVLATLEARVNAGQLLRELIADLPGQQAGDDSGVDELYRYSLAAWVAFAPRGDERKGRAIAQDRILNMVGGELDLKGLLLDSLPDLPAGLTTLDVRSNGLTELRALPESLVKLSAAGNYLDHLPELPEGLTKLDVRTNLLTYLPPLPMGLTTLFASSNRLSELPTLPEGIKTLGVSGNHLTHLPALPASLRMLDISSNRLTHLPPSVFGMPYEGEVNAESNLFSLIFMEQAHKAMLAPGYNGPQIRFEMAFRCVGEAVREWLSNNEQTQIRRWQAHSIELNADGFARFLFHLKAAVDDNAEFKAGVAKWLTKLSQDGEFRQLTFLAAQGAAATCEDRVALTYNDLTKLSHAHAVSRGDYDNRLVEIVERGRGAFRLDALERIARKKAEALWLVDKIEVYLAYQVQLRDRLHLPTDIANMRFLWFSRVDAQDLEDAVQEVLAREQTEFSQYFLVEWEPWQQVLARLDPEGTERAHQKLQDMLADYDREVSAQLASLGVPEDPETQAQAGVGLMKVQQLAVYEELTRELLRKRGEEALMDQILGAANR
ncbi:putative E3 ubiquitin-protein ligase ipaH4.5 [Pandoraea horticolens]|uniref:Putative E3 ubiquitin-protein ligase ipaH4.5 n=2 Tax=Pandoraea horticolens TaxID=2508298 RepID=A0A5E4XY27_9BURK|nr:putative E3 ubiquitin-protein ligase ipaH4.5 [Pandoraea horticolens]